MRCSAWSSLAISACSAVAAVLGLLAAPAALAHVELTPSFVAAGGTERVSVVGHNDRAIPMTTIAVTVPQGFGVDSVVEVDGWEASVDGRTATWRGGRLAPDANATFGLVVQAPGQPGAVQLEVAQTYPDGAIVYATAALTVVPGDEPSDGDVWPYVIAAAGLLLALAGVVLAWRRRDSTPQA